MQRLIRDLDFEALIARVVAATDVTRGTSRDGIIQSALARTGRGERVSLLRSKLVIAATRDVRGLDEIVFERPLVKALVRVQHHPRPPTFPLSTIPLDNGTDVGPHLSAIVEAHPELPWDADAVQRHLVDALLEHGDRLTEERHAPWLMPWGPASSAAHALFTFITLRALGDLDVDAWEKGVHDAALEHFARTKAVEPSSLVEPPPAPKRRR